MARKPAVRSKDKSALLAAVDHAYIVSGGVAAYAPYCIFAPGWLVGYDGIVGSGYRIAEDLHACPHTETFRQALARAGNPYGLTVLSSGNVVVTGHKVRVEISGFPPDAIPNVVPDAPRHEVTEQLRECLVDVSKVAKAKSEHVFGSSVYLSNSSAVASDGGTILEAWHGLNLPGTWLLPVEFVQAVDKVKYKPTHIGWSDDTFTIWYGPNCWLRANVYQENYPDTDVMFARMIADTPELRPVPVDMLHGLEILKPFREDDTITLWQGGFNTRLDGLGASFTFDHHMITPAPRLLPYEALRHAGAHGDWIGFNPNGFYWYGARIRGISAASK